MAKGVETEGKKDGRPEEHLMGDGRKPHPPHLVQVRSRQGVCLTRYDDNGVSSDYSWREERYEGQKRVVVGTGYSNHTHWFINADCAAIECCFLGNKRSVT